MQRPFYNFLEFQICCITYIVHFVYLHWVNGVYYTCCTIKRISL